MQDTNGHTSRNAFQFFLSRPFVNPVFDGIKFMASVQYARHSPEISEVLDPSTPPYDGFDEGTLATALGANSCDSGQADVAL